MIDRTVAPCPTPPKITRYASARPVRVMCNYNPTPIFTPNADFVNDGKKTQPDKNGAFAELRSTAAQEYCLQLGFTPSFMVENGVENNATLWHDGATFDGATPAGGDSGHYFLPWGREGNNCDPLNPNAAAGCAALAAAPTTFGAKLPPCLPLVLDIESTAAYNGAIDTTAQVLGQIRAWDERLATYRRFLGNDHELYAYFFRGYALFRSQLGAAFTAEVEQADRAMMRRLSGINVGAYVGDVAAQNPGNWFAWMDLYAGHVRDNYPFHFDGKWATITPTYQVNWATTPEATKRLNHQPVPIELWQAQVRYLVERHGGWNLYVWIPPGMALKPVKGHLDHLAKYAMGVG
jgi:hypothetical protein